MIKQYVIVKFSPKINDKRATITRKRELQKDGDSEKYDGNEKALITRITSFNPP